MEELSLLVWLSRGSKDKLIKLMCKYTGCDKEVYDDKEIIQLMELTIIDISRKYHIKNLMFEYFEAKNRWQDRASLFPSKYTYSEIDVLSSVILSITKKVLDEEDWNTIEELKKEYLEDKGE